MRFTINLDRQGNVTRVHRATPTESCNVDDADHEEDWSLSELLDWAEAHRTEGILCGHCLSEIEVDNN